MSGPELGDRLVSALLESHRIGIVRRLEAYLSAVDVARFLRAAAPEVIFLSIETRQQALETAKRIEEAARDCRWWPSIAPSILKSSSKPCGPDPGVSLASL